MNPFSYGTIVKGQYFMTGTKSVCELFQPLQVEIILFWFAPRRYGKTSLVFRAIEEFGEVGSYLCLFRFYACLLA